MRGTKRRYGHGKYEAYRTEEQLLRRYEYAKSREGEPARSYRIDPAIAQKLYHRKQERDSRRELVESLARQAAGDSPKLLQWYRIAFGIAVARIPSRDREDIAQEIVLAILRQERREGKVSEALARIIAKRIVFAYYDQAHARRIENRSYANLLFAIPGKINLSPDAIQVIPGGIWRTQVMLADAPVEPISTDIDLEAAEDKAEVNLILNSLPPAITPILLKWLNPERRVKLSDRERQAISRLTRKLRRILAVA